MMNRRVFTGSLAATAAWVACGKRIAAQEQPAKPGPYIDVHVHITQQWNQREELKAKSLLDWMDKHNVERACVLPLVSPEGWFFSISVDYVLKHTRDHRDRLIPFCAVDPRTINLGGYKGVLDILKRFVDAGAKGFDGYGGWRGRDSKQLHPSA